LRYYLQTGFDYKPQKDAGPLGIGKLSENCQHVGGVPITSGASGTVAFTDPTVLNGGSIESDTAWILDPHHYELSQIAFRARTTLAYLRAVTIPAVSLTPTSSSQTGVSCAPRLLRTRPRPSPRHGCTLLTEAPKLGRTSDGSTLGALHVPQDKEILASPSNCKIPSGVQLPPERPEAKPHPRPKATAISARLLR
jgi:hypothetical protein